MFKAILYSISALILATSCNKQGPVACFVKPDGILEINTPLKFKDCSQNAKEYEYKFGDGNSSDEPSPEHSYAEVGKYQVALKVKGEKDEDELVRTINLVRVPLTDLVNGDFQGTYVETYPTDTIYNNEYSGGCNVVALSLKEMVLYIPRGSFETRPVGTNAQLTFTELNKIDPERLQNLTRVTGSYSHASGSLTFTLSGTDPNLEDIPWQIRFTGKKI